MSWPGEFRREAEGAVEGILALARIGIGNQHSALGCVHMHLANRVSLYLLKRHMPFALCANQHVVSGLE